MTDNCPRLVEVARPIREIAAEAVRDRSARVAHLPGGLPRQPIVNITLAALVLLLVLTGGCRRTTPPRPDLDRLAWFPFRWAPFDVGQQHFEHAALLVPIEIKDLPGPLFMQFDLGSDATILYGRPYEELCHRHGRDFPQGESVSLDGRIGNLPVRGLPVRLARDFGDPLDPGDPAPLIGTVGVDLFARRTLLLDFTESRMAILDEGEPLPGDIERAASFVPARLRDKKLFVPITVNETRYQDDFFYDTGSSIVAISTTRDLWKRFTGRTGDEPDNTVLVVPSWDKEVRLVGAPVRGAVRVGEAEIEHPLVFFDATGTFDFSTWGFKVRGLIGNVLFDGRFLVIVDLPRQRFGLWKRR